MDGVLKELFWRDKEHLKVFLGLIDKIFYLRLAPAIAMLSVCGIKAKSSYKAVIHNGVVGENIVVCNFRTRKPRGKLSPEECRWQAKIQVASAYGKGSLAAISYFPSCAPSAYYTGRNYSKIIECEGDSGFQNAIILAIEALRHMPRFPDTETFVATMYQRIRHDLGYKDLTF